MSRAISSQTDRPIEELAASTRKEDRPAFHRPSSVNQEVAGSSPAPGSQLLQALSPVPSHAPSAGSTFWFQRLPRSVTLPALSRGFVRPACQARNPDSGMRTYLPWRTDGSAPRRHSSSTYGVLNPARCATSPAVSQRSSGTPGVATMGSVRRSRRSASTRAIAPRSSGIASRGRSARRRASSSSRCAAKSARVGNAASRRAPVGPGSAN